MAMRTGFRFLALLISALHKAELVSCDDANRGLCRPGKATWSAGDGNCIEAVEVEEDSDSSLLQRPTAATTVTGSYSKSGGIENFSMPLASEKKDSNLISEARGLGLELEAAPQPSGRVGRFHYWLHAAHHGNQTDSKHATPAKDMPIWQRIAGLAGAALATLSINLVDVVWIMPFITSKVNGLKNSLIYIGVCQFFLLVSILIATLRSAATDGHSEMSKLLDIVSAALLTAYSIYLVFEEIIFAGEPEKKEESEPEGTPEEIIEATKSSDKSNPLQVVSVQFFILSVLGSVDQVAVYVPVLSTKALSAFELEIGGIASTVFAVAVCRCLGEIDVIMRFAEAIPMWLIVVVLTVASYVQLLVDV